MLLVVLLYLPFVDGWQLPAGSLGTYLAQWRFNGPLFRWLAAWLGTAPVVALAVAAGLAVAVHARRTRDRDDPAAWIWPLAAAICLLPAIYPWYLVWLIPFLGPLTTWPVVVWTLASMLTYTVWDAAPGGRRLGAAGVGGAGGVRPGRGDRRLDVVGPPAGGTVACGCGG